MTITIPTKKGQHPNVYCYATENVMDAFWELNPHYEQEGFASIIGKENL